MSATPAPRIETLAIVGVGLIGGSFALALRRAGEVGRVIGVGRRRANLETALARGIVDDAWTVDEPWAGAVSAADLVLLATPVAQMPSLLAELGPRLAPATVVTDAGSTKCDVVAAARAALGPAFARFVLAHPIAGTEFSGAEAAYPELFAGRNVVLCPQPDTETRAQELVARAWAATGARVQRLAADEHDRVFAAVSHLPHLLAFALVSELARRPDAELFFRYAASGFRDFTRIASSHPEMWRDICVANRDALLTELAAFQGELEAMRAALQAGDADTLERAFRVARDARNAWLAERDSRPGGSAITSGGEPR